MERLPPELSIRICEFLQEDGFFDSVLAFASVSKAFHVVASSILANTIKLRPTPELGKQVRHVEAILQRYNNFARVREVIIEEDSWLPTEDDMSGINYPDLHGWVCPPEKTGPERRDAWLRIEEAGGTDVDHSPKRHFHRYAQDSTSNTATQDWLMTANLISKLPFLRDLIFACTQQIPECLLDTLHDRLPSCKLHMRNFQLRSIESPTWDAFDLKLITSPCLHSIRHRKLTPGEGFRHEFQRFTTEDADYEEQESIVDPAIAPLMAKMVPGLKEVNSSFEPSISSMSQRRWTARHRRHWSHPRCGSIHVLQIDASQDHINEGHLEPWIEATCFSDMRFLNCLKPLELGALRQLASISFPHLTNLCLCWHRHEHRHGPQYLEEMLGFIHAVSHQLVALKIASWSPVLGLSSILGPKLQSLDLQAGHSSPCTIEDVRQIVTNSPQISHLAVAVLRSRGDAQEVATYKALGKLGELRKLNLRLKVLRPMVPRDTLRQIDERIDKLHDEYVESLGGEEHLGKEEWYNDTDYENAWSFAGDEDVLSEYISRDIDSTFYPYSEHAVWARLVDVAIDRDLARDIFDSIAGTRKSLESMHLMVDSWHSPMRFYQQMEEELSGCYGVLSRAWHVQRDPRYEHRAEVHVRPAQESNLMMELVDSYWREQFEKTVFHDVFQKIWPSEEASCPQTHSWESGWRSFPLAAEK